MGILLNLLKSKKIWITILGIVICAILWLFKAPIELITSVSALFGITLFGHTITDIVSILKESQKPK